MERLWAPWRMEYIAQAREEGEECVFCGLLEKQDEEALILARAQDAFAVMNIYPYNPGHVLVATRRHVGDMEDLTDAEAADTDALLRVTVGAIREVMRPEGFNLGMNLGRVSGAGVPGHIHWHVVPRWRGDSNFMSVVGETRTLPELVPETYAKLRPAFAR